MVEQLRAKWSEDLEELLQCPVCYDRPKPPIGQCQRGHHICTSCKAQMGECPLCKSTFSTARSYLAEELSNKLDDIKLSLLHPNHLLNRKNQRNVGSQTDGMATIIKNEGKTARRAPPPAPKGRFPCRLGTCDVILPHGRMIPHIRYHHSNKFYEVVQTIKLDIHQHVNTKNQNIKLHSLHTPGKDVGRDLQGSGQIFCCLSSANFHFMIATTPGVDTYRQVWEMDYNSNTAFDLAIRVPGMGLFFMRISIDGDGDLFGIVQIVSTHTIGKEFEYELKVGNGKRSSSFRDGVCSCRASHVYLFQSEDCLKVERKDMRRITELNDCSFACTMNLTRLPTTDDKKP